MSYWVRPTTADIGIRAFGKNANDLVKEMTIGMQSILLAENQDLNSITRKTARWEVMHDGDLEILVVKWLDEVLYRCEVYDEFLLECQPMIKDDMIEAQVSFVSKDDVDFEIEIKAVTTHEFAFREVEKDETIPSEWEEVPSFDGPGWYGDVVFDI
ncbi:MAG TPA: archease [Candidatus Poseidoniaceae archaeon]|nr:archease [Candidatus Poseidoniaceae archaeon]